MSLRSRSAPWWRVPGERYELELATYQTVGHEIWTIRRATRKCIERLVEMDERFRFDRRPVLRFTLKPSSRDARPA